MLDRFTDRARKVMSLAKEEAKSLKTTKVGTEHLLLALAKEQEGIAAEAPVSYPHLEPICASTVPFGAAQHDAKRINASGSPWAYRRRDDEVGRDVLFCCNWNTSPTENPRYAARRLSTSTSNV